MFAIRQLTAEDWDDYQRLRLESLARHPGAFMPSRDETKFTPEEWQQRLANPKAATFGLYDDGGDLVGISGLYIDSDGVTAHLVGSYLRAEFRGKSLSRLFYDARIEWAKRYGVRRLQVEHRADNQSSARAHVRYGFKAAGSYEEVWPDGKSYPTLVYVLEI